MTASMLTDPKLLTLVQWLSPAYPVGAFAYSHGLEAAVQRGWVSDAATLQDWLEDVLQTGSGRSDVIWLYHAWRGAQPVQTLDALARAYQPAAERLREAERQGAAFARVTASVWDLDLPPLLLPIALGHAARQMDMQAQPVATLYLHSFASNLVSAGQRLMALGQTDAQAVLAALTPICAEVAAAAETAEIDDIWSTAFRSDVAAMVHETLEPRLFQS